jgi:hypothetical protein
MGLLLPFEVDGWGRLNRWLLALKNKMKVLLVSLLLQLNDVIHILLGESLVWC